MLANTEQAERSETQTQGSILAELLQGYRFSVCQTVEAAEKALDIRRRVYNGGCGYQVPVPDQYDSHSWLLLAEDLATGQAVGTMRLTPRFAGTLEAEEYFRLPIHLRTPRTVELNRFAILPEYRKGKTFLPAVSCGLFKLVGCFLPQVGARYMAVCSKAERMWTYEWLGFQRSGLVTRYAKLQNAEHELLWCDFQTTLESMVDHPFGEIFSAAGRPAEVTLPTYVPALDLGLQAGEPMRIAVGA